MSMLTELIKEKAAEVLTGSVSIPENLQEKVLGGLSDSIFDSIKDTASQDGGLDQLKALFTGKEDAASSPVTALASNLFSSNVAKKLGLSSSLVDAVVPMIPKVLNMLTSGKGIDAGDLLSDFVKDSAADLIKEKAGSLLGGLFKK